MALYIFSDAHLGTGSAESEHKKLANISRLFEHVKADGDRLIILGDLFDFWFEYKHVVPKAHFEVLFQLHELRSRGIQVDYISGNHDFWMDDFFATQLNIPVHRDTLTFEHGGRRFYLTHGDGLAKADSGYRFLKRILRNRFNIWLYRKLPPDWAYPLAKWVSGSSREYTSRRDHQFAADYKQFAELKLSEGFDVVVIGHLHIPVFEQSERGIYINSGDFIHHFSYVRSDSVGVKLEFLK